MLPYPSPFFFSVSVRFFPPAFWFSGFVFCFIVIAVFFLLVGVFTYNAFAVCAHTTYIRTISMDFSFDRVNDWDTPSPSRFESMDRERDRMDREDAWGALSAFGNGSRGQDRTGRANDRDAPSPFGTIDRRWDEPKAFKPHNGFERFELLPRSHPRGRAGDATPPPIPVSLFAPKDARGLVCAACSRSIALDWENKCPDCGAVCCIGRCASAHASIHASTKEEEPADRSPRAIENEATRRDDDDFSAFLLPK